MKISITIPFHNEEKNLEILLPKLFKNLLLLKKENFEIILVDDLSTDRSYQICNNFIRKNKKIKCKLLKLKKKGGQTGALKKAFSVARGNFIITMDADLQDRPKDISKFVKKIRSGYDVVLGFRMKRKSSYILKFSIIIYDFLLSLFINAKLKSFRAQYAAFRRSYLIGIPKYKNDHRYLCPIAIHRGASKLTEVLLEHKKRKYGHSKYQQLPKIVFGFFEVILFLIRLKLGLYRLNKTR
tara:strand:+ start:9352 stop:10071 length:720 start_codon:yes stop_codon:yes gene_type:complete